MKNLSLVTIFLIFSTVAFSKDELKTTQDSVSYMLGLNTAKTMKMQFPDVKLNVFIKGLIAVYSNTNEVNEDALKKVVEKYFAKKQEEEKSKMLKEQEVNKVVGVEFLKKNKLKKGVKTTASGLQYMIIKEGSGKSPSDTSTVEVHYHGTTPKGVVFDSSVDRKKTATFPLNRVIKGWTEGLQLMKEGAKYKFFIPQELAYGANAPQGGKGAIKPFMPLVFEVELIKIVK